MVSGFQDALEREEVSKRHAENTLRLLKKKLEENKRILDEIKNPKPRAREPKTFLASEKLASAKKQTNQSIAIESRNQESKSVSPVKFRRTRSASRS